MTWTSCRVFSATLHRQRQTLGEQVTEWIRRERVEVVDVVVRQSSDREYHCISVVVFHR